MVRVGTGVTFLPHRKKVLGLNPSEGGGAMTQGEGL